MLNQMLNIEIEKMSDEFTKHHIKGLPFGAVIHHFTAPDKGNPHDHPFGFTSFILSGGYVEKVYKISYGGQWSSELVYRPPGLAHYVQAHHIHEIVELPNGECYTLIVPGKKVRETRFWLFEENQIKSRAWNEADFN